jgi:asparagine synthase (glutamine-hydrolysing)
VDPETLAEELRRRLGDAVRGAGRSIGVLLTGDVESGLLCALAAADGLPLHTFGVALDETSLELARLVADQYETSHDELLVPRDVSEILARLAAAAAEPPADPLVLQRFLACELADGRVDVLLSAAGAELLSGPAQAALPASALVLSVPVAEHMPYLDESVAELARGLEPRLKSRRLTSKPLLRRAALPLLAGAVVHAPDRHARVRREFAGQVQESLSLWTPA